jgi:hypothetical protein
MSSIHPKSSECPLSELDLFLAPATQRSVDRGHWHEYHPTTALQNTRNNKGPDQSPIEFYIPATGDDYLDVARSFLYIEVR